MYPTTGTATAVAGKRENESRPNSFKNGKNEYAARAIAKFGHLPEKWKYFLFRWAVPEFRKKNRAAYAIFAVFNELAVFSFTVAPF